MESSFSEEMSSIRLSFDMETFHFVIFPSAMTSRVINQSQNLRQSDNTLRSLVRPAVFCNPSSPLSGNVHSTEVEEIFIYNKFVIVLFNIEEKKVDMHCLAVPSDRRGLAGPRRAARRLSTNRTAFQLPSYPSFTLHHADKLTP